MQLLLMLLFAVGTSCQVIVLVASSTPPTWMAYTPTQGIIFQQATLYVLDPGLARSAAYLVLQGLGVLNGVCQLSYVTLQFAHLRLCVCSCTTLCHHFTLQARLLEMQLLQGWQATCSRGAGCSGTVQLLHADDCWHGLITLDALRSGWALSGMTRVDTKHRQTTGLSDAQGRTLYMNVTAPLFAFEPPNCYHNCGPQSLHGSKHTCMVRSRPELLLWYRSSSASMARMVSRISLISTSRGSICGSQAAQQV